MLTKWTPLRLAPLALVGSLVMVSEFLMAVGLFVLWKLPIGPHSSSFAIVEMLVSIFAPLMTGVLIVQVAKWRLYGGLGKDEWSEQEVDVFRRWIESPRLLRMAKCFIWSVRFAVMAGLFTGRPRISGSFPCIL